MEESIQSTEHTCQFCYYECFDEKAYPCSLCMNGVEREDLWQPKIRQARKEEGSNDG